MKTQLTQPLRQLATKQADSATARPASQPAAASPSQVNQTDAFTAATTTAISVATSFVPMGATIGKVLAGAAEGFKPAAAEDGAGSTDAVTVAQLSAEEEQAAGQTIALASDSRDASHVANWLRNNPDPGKQAAFMKLMFQFESVAGTVLDNVNNLPESDRALLSQALEQAYSAGAITDEDIAKAVVGYGHGAGPGETHEALASIVAGTGNPDLIEAYAKAELAVMSAEGSHDPQRAAAVATALGGLPPERLQAFLEANPEAMNQVLGNINVDFDAENSPALSLLLDAAAAISPPTPESIKLFSDAIPLIGENTDSRAAAARFFTAHGDEVLASMQDNSGSIGLDGQKRLSELFTRTLFSPPQDFEGSEAFRETVMSRLGDLQAELELHAGENPPSQDAKRSARLLGSIVGSLEGGFQVAIDELNARNDAVDGMADLLFSAKGLLPSLPIPGAGKLVDLSLEQLKDWAASQFKENPADPSEAIPFHRAFGELISNPDLRTDYDAARSDAFLNRQRGLS